MMKRGHRAVATPVAVVYGYTGAVTDVAHPMVAAAAAVLVVGASTFPDYDHPRFRGKRNPVAAAVRASARLGYMIRTRYDKVREDEHRGPSHCVEWCVLLGVLVAAPLLVLGLPVAFSLYVGGAVALGATTHILGDVMTPSGVPLSVLWNVLAYRGSECQVWRRHSLRLFVTDSAGERIGAVPVLYALTGFELLFLLGGLDEFWTVTTGDLFDGRWVVLAVLAGFAVGAALAVARLSTVTATRLAAAGIGTAAQAEGPVVLWAAYAVGAALVAVPVWWLVPGWLPWV